MKDVAADCVYTHRRLAHDHTDDQDFLGMGGCAREPDSASFDMELLRTPPLVQYGKDVFPFIPMEDSYVFWEEQHNFIIFQCFSDNRNNVHGKMRLRCMSWSSVGTMQFEVDGMQLPFDFPVSGWEAQCHCPASTFGDSYTASCTVLKLSAKCTES